MKTYKNPQTVITEMEMGLLCASGDPQDRIGGGTLQGGDNSGSPTGARVKQF